MEIWRPNVLILGGGGVKGFLTIGSLLFFEKTKMLKDIKKIVGVSIGSVIGLLYASGYSMTEILDFSLMTQISEVVSHIDILNIMKTNGFVSHDVFRKKLNEKIISKFGFVPTFKQLYLMTGYHFEVVVTNLDKNVAEYFSHETQPDFSCVEGVLMSMSLPFIFQTYIHNNDIYLDGAIIDPFPLNRYRNDCVFGIILKTTPVNPRESFFNYLSRVIDSFTTTKEKNIIIPPNCKILNLQYQITDTLGIKMSFENRVDMVLFGYLRGYQFYDEIHRIHPQEYPMNIQKSLTKDLIHSFPTFQNQNESFIIDHVEELSDVDSEEMENEGDEYLVDLFESSDFSQSSIDETSESSSEESEHLQEEYESTEEPLNDEINHQLTETQDGHQDIVETEEDVKDNSNHIIEPIISELKYSVSEEMKDSVTTEYEVKIQSEEDGNTQDNILNSEDIHEPTPDDLCSNCENDIQDRVVNENICEDKGEYEVNSLKDTEIQDVISDGHESKISVSDESSGVRVSQRKNKFYSPSKIKKWRKTKKKYTTPEWITKN